MSEFSELIDKAYRKSGLSVAGFAKVIQIAPQTLRNAISGELEKEIKGSMTSRRKKGVSASITRILLKLGEDPSFWLDKLGLGHPYAAVKNEIDANISRSELLESSLTSADIEILGKAQAVLGELLTVEMALQIIMQRKKQEV